MKNNPDKAARWDKAIEFLADKMDNADSNEDFHQILKDALIPLLDAALNVTEAWADSGDVVIGARELEKEIAKWLK
jgi:enterochelin esterase-like enzyme